MRFISNFQDFSLNEATLNDTKIDVDYEVSRDGRKAAERLGISEDMKLVNTPLSPHDDDSVIWIRATSMRNIKFSELKSTLGITSNDDLMIYKTSSRKLKWAVAKRGLRTTMVRQKDKVGAAKRGEHFRESAFMITLAVEAWRLENVEIPVATNRGPVEMVYHDDGRAEISHNERGGFRKEYDLFMIANKPAVNAMIDQCRKLIDHLGSDIKNISYVIKNDASLLINKVAISFMKDEMDFASLPEEDTGEDYGAISMPKRTTLAKWNPSDIWLVFKGSEWTMDEFDQYEEHDIDDLESLNDFLAESVLDVDSVKRGKYTGLIGVSLKQSANIGTLAVVNIDPDRAEHRYEGYEMAGDKKTVTINFSYRFDPTKGFIQGSEIQIRTFDTTNKSNISLEIKGSKRAKHMSGKAGSILEYVMPEKFYEVKEFIRTHTNKQDIANYMQSFQFEDPDLEDIFNDDLRIGSVKTAEQNSGMQSIIVLEWFNTLREEEANEIVSKIIRFAKSESNWSAAHLLCK